MTPLHPARVYHMPPPLPATGPRITPAEAVAIALSTALARPFGPDHLVVQMVLRALKSAGWKIVED
jgi:hypothetical protein